MEDKSGGWSSMVKKEPFTTSSQEKNTLLEVGMSISTIKYFTRANTEGSPQGANKARLDFAKNI